MRLQTVSTHLALYVVLEIWTWSCCLCDKLCCGSAAPEDVKAPLLSLNPYTVPIARQLPKNLTCRGSGPHDDIVTNTLINLLIVYYFCVYVSVYTNICVWEYVAVGWNILSMCKCRAHVQTEAMVKAACAVTHVSTARNTSDLLCFWFWINVWSLSVQKPCTVATFFMTLKFSYMILHESWLTG